MEQNNSSLYRRPTDLILLMLGAIVLLLSSLVLFAARGYFNTADFTLFRLINEMPNSLLLFLWIVMQMGSLAAVPVVAALALLAKRRMVAAKVLVSGSAAWVLAKLVKLVVFRDRPTRLLEHVILRGDEPTGLGFPSGHVTIAAAMAVVVSPYLKRNQQWIVWVAVLLVAFARIYVGAHFPLDIIGGLALGSIIGALTNLLMGVKRKDLSASSIRRAFKEYEIEVTEITPVADDARGSVPYFVKSDNDERYFIKLVGSEQRNADFLFKVWRTILLKSAAHTAPFLTPQQQVEHEAYLTLLARDHEVRTPDIEFTTATPDDFAIMAQKRIKGETLGQLDAETISDELLLDIWRQVKRLHEARIVHGDLRLANILLDEEGQPWIIDFGFAAGGARDEHLAQDVAQLLASFAPRVGVERTVDTALQVLEPEKLARAIPVMEPLALSSTTREDLKEQPDMLDNLKTRLVERTGIEPPEEESIFRIQPKTVLWVLGLGVGVYLLLPQVGELSTLMELWRTIQPVWLIAGLGVTALLYLMSSFALQGALKEHLPLPSLVLAHLAATFANRFGPRGVGGAYVLEQYVEQSGIQRRRAVTAVTLKAVAGGLVHLLLVLVALLLTGESIFRLLQEVQPWQVGLVVTGLAILLIFLMRSPERLQRVKGSIDSSLNDLRATLHDPANASQLIGGSLGITLSHITVLAFSLWAIGVELPLPAIAVAYLVGELVGAASPTPGGLGVVEGAMVTGLIAFGIPSEPAVAGVLIYRLLTFWLPILPGLVAFRYLNERELL